MSSSSFSLMNLSADFLDDAGGLMARDHRQRIAQRAVDHFEIGVAETRRPDAHDDVG